MKNNHVVIIGKKYSMKLLETEYWYIIDKICNILFSKKYNKWAIEKARSVLDWVVKNKMMTWKQAKLIMDIKPTIR